MKNFKILLVDDDPFILMGISKDLKSQGYSVITANSGKIAVDLLNQEAFDLVITDLIMEGIDGIEVLKKAKALNPLTMVIILSSHGDMEAAIDAFRNGVDDHIFKPCDSEELYFRVSRCLDKLESQRKLKASEEILRESKRMLSTLMDNLPGMVYRCQNDKNWTMEFISDGCLKLTGYKVPDLIGNKKLCFNSLIHPDDQSQVWDQIQKALTDRRRFQIEYRIRTASGEEKWVWEQGAGVFSEEGDLLALEGFITDITKHKRAEKALCRANDELEMKVERRTFELKKINKRLKREIEERNQAEEALRESEERYRSLVENIELGICLISPDMRILALNRQMKKWFPRIDETQRPLCYRSFNTPPHDEICEYCPTYQTLMDGQTHESVTETPAGEEIKHFRIISSPIMDKDGNITGAIEMVEDITRTKRLQDQLIRSERLAATGQLAASIAHEINSPLQGITALLNLIKKTCIPIRNEALLENIDLLKGAFENIRDTVKKLLDLNRPANKKKQFASVNKIIEDTVALLRNHLKKSKVKVNLKLFPPLPSIKASSQELGQVFINLINNAVEAIRSESDIGGEITITTSLKEDNIIIKVSDTGSGISNKDLHHIFDPFYTRKKTMGMGIGLSVCHDIIKEHNGAIIAMNSPEGGAVFTITLPAESDIKKLV